MSGIGYDIVLLNKKDSAPPCSKSKSGVCVDDEHNINTMGECMSVCNERGANKYAFDQKTNKCICEGFQPSDKSKLMNKNSNSDNDLQYYDGDVPAQDGILRCGSKKMVTEQNNNDADPQHRAPAGYFSKITTDNNSSAWCGCDASMAGQFNCKIRNFSGNQDDPPTLAKMFQNAVNDKSKKGNLYQNFSDEIDNTLTEVCKGKGDDCKIKALKALSANAVCQMNNISNPREISAPGTDNPSGWLNYYGSKFNLAFKMVVILIVTYLTFRSFYPKGGFKSSIFNAIIIPNGLPSNWLTKGLMFIVFIIVVILISVNKTRTDVFKFYIPDTIQSFLSGGIMFSLYFMILAYILNITIGQGLNFSNGFISILILFISYFGFGIIKTINTGESYKDAIDPTKSKFNEGFFTLILTGIILIIGTFIAKYAGVSNAEKYPIYFVGTLLGLAPLAMVLIIANFALAIVNPAAEFMLLIIYRMLGMFWSFNPTGVYGRLILLIFGVKPTDKWILPLLPWVTLPLRLYYALNSNKNLPDYFTVSGSSTGVSNTNLWLS